MTDLREAIARATGLPGRVDQVLAAIEAAGWQCVPKEPTPDMLRNGAVNAGVPETDETEREWLHSDYKAMLAAAPKPL